MYQGMCIKLKILLKNVNCKSTHTFFYLSLINFLGSYSALVKFALCKGDIIYFNFTITLFYCSNAACDKLTQSIRNE